MADKKRRDKGDGCFSQRADGTWTARIRVGLTPEGKPKIKAFYGKSEREVAVPGAMPVTVPSLETVAISSSDDAHVVLE